MKQHVPVVGVQTRIHGVELNIVQIKVKAGGEALESKSTTNKTHILANTRGGSTCGAASGNMASLS